MALTEEELTLINDLLVDYKNTKEDKQKEQLKNKIVSIAMPMVKQIAGSLARRATDPVDDLIQVGFLGLIKAIDLFDPTISSKFKTYASYLITGEIRHYLRDKASMIKAPREIQELAYRINTVVQKLAEEGIEEPSIEQIAEYMSMPVDKISTVIEIDRRKSTVSLDQTYSNSDDDSFSLADKIPDGDYQELLNLYDEKMVVTHAIEQLPEDLRNVIALSYTEDLNQREIAERLQISQMQVSRRLKKSVVEIRKILEDEANKE